MAYINNRRTPAICVHCGKLKTICTPRKCQPCPCQPRPCHSNSPGLTNPFIELPRRPMPCKPIIPRNINCYQPIRSRQRMFPNNVVYPRNLDSFMLSPVAFAGLIFYYILKLWYYAIIIGFEAISTISQAERPAQITVGVVFILLASSVLIQNVINNQYASDYFGAVFSEVYNKKRNKNIAANSLTS